MKKRNTVFIFHGTEGHPDENWFPWLKREMEQRSCRVIVPQFPSPPVVPAKIAEWFEVLKRHEPDMDENTILIGHSLGGVFALRVLERIARPIKAAVFVGTPIGIQPIQYFDRDKSFSGFRFDWKTIRTKARYFDVYHSDNDEYVDLENGKELAQHLGVELSFIPNAGHFNTRSGITTFPKLRDRVFVLCNSD
jgi:uncharacterized protein